MNINLYMNINMENATGGDVTSTYSSVSSSTGYYDNVSEATEYVPVYDYWDTSERMSYVLKTPHIILTLILGTIAISANLVCIAAIFQARRRWTTLFRCMLSLLLSDVLVDTSVMVYNINWVLNPLYQPGLGPLNERIKSRCAFVLIKALNTMGLNVTLLNLVGMAIDHYVAIMFPLHYTSVLNVKRSQMMIIVIWLSAFVSAFSNLASPLWTKKKAYKYYMKLNYCEKAWLSSYQEEYITFAIAAICFTVMCTIYIRIYLAIRSKQRNTVIYQPRTGKSRDKTKRNTRALLTTFFILGTFTVCWLPLCLFQIAMIIIVKVGRHLLTDSVMTILTNLDEYLYLLVLINTICDPIIYAIRIGEVRQGIVKLISKFLPIKLRQKLLYRFNDDLRNTSNMSVSLLAERRSTTQSSGFDDAKGDSNSNRHGSVVYRASIDRCSSLDRSVSFDQRTPLNQSVSDDQRASFDHNTSDDQRISRNRSVSDDQRVSLDRSGSFDQRTPLNQSVSDDPKVSLDQTVLGDQKTLCNQSPSDDRRASPDQSATDDQRTSLNQTVSDDQRISLDPAALGDQEVARIHSISDD